MYGICIGYVYKKHRISIIYSKRLKGLSRTLRLLRKCFFGRLKGLFQLRFAAASSFATKLTNCGGYTLSIPAANRVWPARRLLWWSFGAGGQVVARRELCHRTTWLKFPLEICPASLKTLYLRINLLLVLDDRVFQYSARRQHWER